MSNPLKKYGVDRSAEAKGTDVAIDDMNFVIRSASAINRGYRYALALAANKRRDELSKGGSASFDAHESILIEAFADSVVLGWSGVDGEDGQPLEFNRDNCIRILESCPEIWDRIKEIGLDTDRFQTSREDGEQLGKSLSG